MQNNDWTDDMPQPFNRHFFIHRIITTPSDRMDSVNERQQKWIYAVLIGAINIIIGVLLVIFKKDSLDVILIVTGVLLAIDGALTLIGGILKKDLIPMIIGGVMLALGIALIILPGFFADIFMILLAILLIIMGVIGAISLLDKKDQNIISIVFSAVIAVAMIAAGILALMNLNDAQDWTMIIIGVIMIVTGALNVCGGLLAYKALKNPQ